MNEIFKFLTITNCIFLLKAEIVISELNYTDLCSMWVQNFFSFQESQ